MGIGVSIFLIAVGAILTWAVDWSIGAIDVNVIGVILMVAGVGGLTMFFYFWNRQRVPEAVTALRQQPVPVPQQPRTYDDTTPPATVTTVTPPKPQPGTVTTVAPQQPQPGTVTTVAPQQPLPAAVTTVTATAPVHVPSQGPRQGD